MSKPASLLAGLLIAAVAASPLVAQTTTTLGTGRGGSAHVKSSWVVGGANISIAYGRPSLKGRPESQMMPVGKPWRTGADAATVLTTDRALTFGTVTLKPGSYTINTEPGEKAWQLLFGTVEKPDQWGVPYLPKLEIGRAPLTLAHVDTPSELLTFSIDHASAKPALRIEWGTVRVTTPFTVAK